MRVSVELVPRSAEELRLQLEQAAALSTVDTVNIPDVGRFPLRAWECCGPALQHVRYAIPHLVATDHDIDEWVRIVGRLRSQGVEEVLVVGGDATAGEVSRGSGTVDLIEALASLPDAPRIYATVDPYRQGFVAELAYSERKLAAGASGLFSQPFFDLRLLAIYAELLAGTEVFWGVTSVTSKRSQRYWRERNRAVFPAGFQPTLEWNRSFASAALDFVASNGGNIYFMPIRANIPDYLGGLL